MADKDFRVKNKLHVNGLSQSSGVILATSNALDAHTNLPTQYGGTGTTTSPAAGQVLFSSAGATYTPTTLTSLDVKGATYSADAPVAPFVGQVWIESDSSSDSFDPNIMRRKTITATAGQTTFTTDLEFIQGYEQVYFNGMLLLRTTDYTTPTNTSVVLAAAAAAGDIVEILSITNLNSINAATTTTNTFTGQQTIQGNLVVGGSIPNLSSSTKAITVDSSSASDYAALEMATGGTLRGYLNATNGAMYIAAVGSNPLVTYTNGSERMRIDSSGKVGIGNNSVASGYKMSLNGTLNVYENSAGLGRIFFGDPADSNGYIGIYRSSLGPSNYNTYGNGLNFASIDGYVFSTPTAPNYIYGVQTERMRIASDGTLSLQYVDASAPVLYNTANNNNKLMIFEGYAGNRWNLWGGHGGNSYFGISENASSTPVFAITGSTNYVLVGYTSSQGSYKLQVNSQIFATSSTIATSDGRFKENVNTIESGLNIIDALRPVSFNWKEHAVHNFPEGKTVGFIAQEVQEALSDYDWKDNIIKSNISEAVLDEEGNIVHPEEEFLGIAEGNLIPLLVAAVKELKSRVETLEAANV